MASWLIGGVSLRTHNFETESHQTAKHPRPAALQNKHTRAQKAKAAEKPGRLVGRPLSPSAASELPIENIWVWAQLQQSYLNFQLPLIAMMSSLRLRESNFGACKGFVVHLPTPGAATITWHGTVAVHLIVTCRYDLIPEKAMHSSCVAFRYLCRMPAEAEACTISVHAPSYYDAYSIALILY